MLKNNGRPTQAGGQPIQEGNMSDSLSHSELSHSEQSSTQQSAPRHAHIAAGFHQTRLGARRRRHVARRQFGLGTGLNIARAANVAGSGEIKVALIGCGGRGNGAALQALETEGKVTLWAMADAFAEQVTGGLESDSTRRREAAAREGKPLFAESTHRRARRAPVRRASTPIKRRSTAASTS